MMNAEKEAGNRGWEDEWKRVCGGYKLRREKENQVSGFWRTFQYDRFSASGRVINLSLKEVLHHEDGLVVIHSYIEFYRTKKERYSQV
jgi:hypothetical protein